MKTEKLIMSPMAMQRYIRTQKARLIRAIPITEDGQDGFIVMYVPWH